MYCLHTDSGRGLNVGAIDRPLVLLEFSTILDIINILINLKLDKFFIGSSSLLNN